RRANPLFSLSLICPARRLCGAPLFYLYFFEYGLKNDRGRTPALGVRPLPKERGYNEMKRNCLLQELSYPRDVNEKNGRCYNFVKSTGICVKILSGRKKAERTALRSLSALTIGG